MNALYPRWKGNEHKVIVRRHFGRLDRAPADLPAELKFVFLCFTNRCGSNFLADLLVSTRRLRHASEFLNAEEVVSAATLHGHRTFQEYFSWHARSRAARCNVVTAKLAIPHLEMLGDSGILDQIFNRSWFVFQTREDRLGQAISWEIARQTGRWSSTTAQSLSGRPPQYSARRLRDAMALLCAQNRQFEAFFVANRIEPLRIVYERLITEQEACVREIGRQVGLDGLQADPSRLLFQRQSSPLNAEWRARFLAENAGLPTGARIRSLLKRGVKRLFS